MPRIGIGLPLGRRKTFRRQRTIKIHGQPAKVVVTTSYYYGELEAYIVTINGERIRRNRIPGREWTWEQCMASAVAHFTAKHAPQQQDTVA